MQRIGAIVRRGDLYGVVIAVGNPDFGPPVKVEWPDGRQE